MTGGFARLVSEGLEHLTEPSLDEAPCDERGGEGCEGHVDVGPTLVAHRKAPELGEPSQRALNDPAMAAQALAALDAISCGTSSLGVPERSTNRMRVSTARSGTHGRPPFGLGGSGGSSGAMAAHKPSGRKGLAIAPQRATAGFVRCS